MIAENEHIKAGQITKTHGINGDVILKLSQPVSEKILKMESILVKIDGGLVPFFVNGIKEFQSDTFCLSLDWIIDEHEAADILKKEVYLKKEYIMINDDNSAIQLIGYKVKDINKGYIGSVQEILDMPQQQMLQILNDGNEYLIPITDAIIKEIIEEENEIIVDTPEGLLDLNE